MKINMSQGKTGISRILRLLPVLLMTSLLPYLLTGCEAGGGNNYLIWPTSARSGDTIAILFNTEFDTDSAPESALLDANTDNVSIQLSDSLGHSELITPRAIIEAPAALGSFAVGSALESWTGLVAIFDIPDPWPNTSIAYPDTFTVVVDYQGSPTFGGNSLVVLGAGGAPLQLSAMTPLSQLEAEPMLRLRPAWDPVAGTGFDPAWQIGGLEFNLRYTPAAAGGVSNLAAIGDGEATAGLAMANPLPPQGADKLWKVSLVDPKGFSLPAKGCTGPGECFSGRWSLLDLPLDKDETGVVPGDPVFIANDFAIENVVVVDPDGAQLNPSSTGETFFNTYAVNYRAVPEPGTVLLLVTGALGLALIEWLERHRRSLQRP